MFIFSKQQETSRDIIKIATKLQVHQGMMNIVMQQTSFSKFMFWFGLVLVYCETEICIVSTVKMEISVFMYI